MNSQLRLLQPTKPRLGLYLRPGRNDHTVFTALLAEGRAVSGLVLDARNLERHRQLRENLIGNGVHAVLDTDFMEMSTTGGTVLAGLDTFPWRRFAQATASQLRGQAGRDLAATVADSVATLDFSAVLAPETRSSAQTGPSPPTCEPSWIAEDTWTRQFSTRWRSQPHRYETQLSSR
jgi:hypothetical protein